MPGKSARRNCPRHLLRQSTSNDWKSDAHAAMLPVMLRWLYWLPALGWAGVIYHLSSRPAGPQPSWWFPHADKFIHAGLFGILSLLAYFAARRAPGWPGLRAAVAAFLLAVAYGASDEIHQLFTPTRSSDPWDVAADAAGAAGVFVVRRRSHP
jgi:VanZ family protein